MNCNRLNEVHGCLQQPVTRGCLLHERSTLHTTDNVPTRRTSNMKKLDEAWNAGTAYADGVRDKRSDDTSIYVIDFDSIFGFVAKLDNHQLLFPILCVCVCVCVFVFVCVRACVRACVRVKLPNLGHSSYGKVTHLTYCPCV